MLRQLSDFCVREYRRTLDFVCYLRGQLIACQNALGALPAMLVKRPESLAKWVVVCLSTANRTRRQQQQMNRFSILADAHVNLLWKFRRDTRTRLPSQKLNFLS